MPRQRTLKSEICSSSQVAACSIQARWTFACMMCFCDDGGRHPADVRRLKMEIFPGDDVTLKQVAEWVLELIQATDKAGKGLVEEYEVDGQRYWQLPGWARHQVNLRYPSYKYPDPNGNIPRPPESGKIAAALPQDSSSAAVHGMGWDEKRDSIPPFDASEHLEFWTEARRRAAKTAEGLWPSGRQLPTSEPERSKRMRQSEADNAMLLKIAFLSCSLFTEDWLADAIAGATVKKRDKPIAYFKKILIRSADKRGYYLNDLLDSIQIPPKPENPQEKPNFTPPNFGEIPGVKK